MCYTSFMYGKIKLNQLIFAALCCDFGLIAKKLISPAANVITEYIHIPGGIATSFSLMFLIIAAAVIRVPGCATIMAVVQSLLAFAFGMTGSMGALAPIGYILPGIAIDICLYLSYKLNPRPTSGILAASIASSLCACLAADLIVFHLAGIVLLVYCLVSAVIGAFCSLIAVNLVERLVRIINPAIDTDRTATTNKTATADTNPKQENTEP